MARLGARLGGAAIAEPARAKVNLTLRVKGRREDGYHELESLVAFADVCDELAFTPAAADSLSVEGPFATALDGENLVLKAKRAVGDWLGRDLRGAFHLKKRIPVAAGLGGGSSDAAAAIRILLDVYCEGEAGGFPADRAAAVGADVPVCLLHRAAWMRGLGERVTPIERLDPLPALLVNPGIKLSTAAVFKTLNARPWRPAEGADDAAFPTGWRDPHSAAAALGDHGNDLEAPAIALEPAVANVLASLRSLENCLLARLSGSGPTCFGLFDTVASAAEAGQTLRRARPEWWIAPTVLA